MRGFFRLTSSALQLTRAALSLPRLPEHIDYLSVQAVMMRDKLSIYGRIKVHLKFSKRMASGD